MIVLGVDGMDPVFVEKHWALLPNLDRLRRQGGFQRLATTNPPQSPVAWSAVITGLDPGGHGIFDFVHRDAATITPYSSMAEVLEARRTFALGPWILPLESGQVRNLRQGAAFWTLLGAHGVPARILRMPVNFPPVEFPGESLAGMGTPDLQGGYGTFTTFTSELGAVERTVPGGRIVPVKMQGRRAVLTVEGPVNGFRRSHPLSTAELTVDVDEGTGTALISAGGQRFALRAGEWSPWFRLEFSLLGPAAKARGIARVLLRRVTPSLEVYLSPVNMDPREPALPISTPKEFSGTLAGAVGPFYTQGIAEDTSALRAHSLSHAEFLQQAGQVLDDNMALFRHELDRYEDGLMFYYFSSIDQHAHVLWGRYDEELARIYQRVDEAVGLAMAKLGSDGTLVVMSDHGFSTFDRAVHLNSWLEQEGLLKLIDGSKRGDEELFANVDWSRTQAYALGLNEIYLNLAGREPNGAVAPGEDSQAVLRKISERLLALRDPQTGKAVVKAVYTAAQVATGKLPGYAPDLVVGYEPGYRASWQTALGAVPERIIVPNEEAWLADHCIDPEFVPGVLFTNRKPALEKPHLRDVPVTILKQFGVAVPAAMTGHPMF
ncbi:alkaline phosphatase family protein [Paludibaculum fermentans]|uniref:Alkaline phosphatase family protein n=2 Tax=Paludibaculum fermentans TaxID=1473598 RepID=A0A7S7SN67_PALFE|nr:alkaline phosphatase family protein [Paludibaculum fermentans]